MNLRYRTRAARDLLVGMLRAASRDELSSSLELQDRARQELASSEERLHYAQEIARIGTWDTDLTSAPSA